MKHTFTRDQVKRIILEELEKAAKSLGEDIKKIPQQKGLMAQPKPKEEEIS